MQRTDELEIEEVLAALVEASKWDKEAEAFLELFSSWVASRSESGTKH